MLLVSDGADAINSVAGRLPLSAQCPAHAETLVSQGPNAKPPPRPPEDVRSSESTPAGVWSLSTAHKVTHLWVIVGLDPVASVGRAETDGCDSVAGLHSADQRSRMSPIHKGRGAQMARRGLSSLNELAPCD